MTEFADVLREARERAGLNQHQLANKVGVDHSYISRIERGTSAPPTRDKVIALSEALGITEKRQRLSFLLAAGCTKEEDLEGFRLVDTDSEAATTLPNKLHSPAGTATLGAGVGLSVIRSSKKHQQGLEKAARSLVEQVALDTPLTPEQQTHAERLTLETTRAICWTLAEEQRNK